jgi:hypothetical protein
MNRRVQKRKREEAPMPRPTGGYQGEQLVLWLVLRWALLEEGLTGDRMASICSCVCKRWKEVATNPRLSTGLMRAISFDVGTRNLGMWAGSFRPDRPNSPWTFHAWELIDLGVNAASDACVAFVTGMARKPWAHRYFEHMFVELQPPKLATMAIQNFSLAIFSYFLTQRVLLCGGAPADMANYAHMVSARGKLHVYITDCDTDSLSEAELQELVPFSGMTYPQRKKMAERHTSLLLREAELDRHAHPGWRKWFESVDKADPADAFLNAAYKLRSLYGVRVPPSKRKRTAERVTQAREEMKAEGPPPKRRRRATASSPKKKKKTATTKRKKKGATSD